MTSIATELFGGEKEALRMLYGEDARQGAGWAYFQDQGPGIVGFVGSVKVNPSEQHPFRYGNPHYDRKQGRPEGYRAHHFMVGEVIVRPHLLVATSRLAGTGIAGLYTGHHDLRDMLRDGEVVVATAGVLEQLRAAGEDI